MSNYNQCIKVLSEAGISVDRSCFISLDEAVRAEITDEQLTGMMKFVVDKYNSIDFSEIERSAGNVAKFKYYDMIKENLDMLDNVYKSSDDPGAKKYMEVITACHKVLTHLMNMREEYSELYRQGNGIIQMLYTSEIAAILFCVGTLVSNTIRFVTTEQDTECQVLYDEIPGTIKHVHIKNVVAAANSTDDIVKYMNTVKSANKRTVSESVTGVLIGIGVGIGAAILLIPRLIRLIQEIIYSIYFMRVRVSDMLDLQAKLIKVNIESLEAGRGTKKVIARQKKIAQNLETWKSKIAIKTDTVEAMKNVQIQKEMKTLDVTKDTVASYTPANNDLLL